MGQLANQFLLFGQFVAPTSAVLSFFYGGERIGQVFFANLLQFYWEAFYRTGYGILLFRQQMGGNTQPAHFVYYSGDDPVDLNTYSKRLSTVSECLLKNDTDVGFRSFSREFLCHCCCGTRLY